MEQIERNHKWYRQVNKVGGHSERSHFRTSPKQRKINTTNKKLHTLLVVMEPAPYGHDALLRMTTIPSECAEKMASTSNWAAS
jgi:hypothetical protein